MKCKFCGLEIEKHGSLRRVHVTTKLSRCILVALPEDKE